MMQELSYIRCGDYYIPDIRLLCGSVAEDHRDHSLRSDYLPL